MTKANTVMIETITVVEENKRRDNHHIHAVTVRDRMIIIAILSRYISINGGGSEQGTFPFHLLPNKMKLSDMHD